MSKDTSKTKTRVKSRGNRVSVDWSEACKLCLTCMHRDITQETSYSYRVRQYAPIPKTIKELHKFTTFCLLKRKTVKNLTSCKLYKKIERMENDKETD